MSNLILPKEMLDRFLIRNESVELMRISKCGIWVNPDIPVDEVAQRVFAVLEPMIKQAYVSAAHGLTAQVLDAVQSDAPHAPLPPIREAMDTLMREVEP